MKKLYLALLLAALATPAAAIDFKAAIRNIDGSVVQVSPTDPTPLTLQKVCEDSLIANNLPGDNATADEKGKRFWLAIKIHEGKDPLSADDITLLKKVIGLAYGPLVIGRTTELIDPAAVPK